MAMPEFTMRQLLVLYKNPIKSDTSISEKTSYFAGYNAPLDFTKAADKALDAVVHIKATESPEAAENRFRQSYQQRSPFSFFLGEDDLEGFFGYGPRSKQGTGSGVIISPNGYIVTNSIMWLILPICLKSLYTIIKNMRRHW